MFEILFGARNRQETGNTGLPQKELLPIGPRSVLFGAHQFLIHPLFVAVAWTKLYGFPRDPRLWVAFFVHDLGYLFQWCPDMDGEEGERHCEWGAIQMARWFDRHQVGGSTMMLDVTRPGFGFAWCKVYWCLGDWGQFCLFHSRFYAKREGKAFSRLAVADKLATCLEPWWLWLPRVWASGEIWEYMARAGGMEGSKYNGEPEVGKYAPMNLIGRNRSLSTFAKMRHFHARMVDYLGKWVEAHKDGAEDTWTQSPAQETDRGRGASC